MTALLAVDPGTCTGIAFRRADGSRAWRTWDLTGASPVRLFKLFGRLKVLHESERFARVGCEVPHINIQFPTAVIPLAKYVGVVELFAQSHGLSYAGYEPCEIKRAVATGRADKERMIARVRLLGYPVEDHHQADAVALLLLLEAGVAPAEMARKHAEKERKRQALDLFSPAPRRRAAAIL